MNFDDYNTAGAHQHHPGTSSSVLSWIPSLLLSLLIILPTLVILSKALMILIHRINEDGLTALIRYAVTGNETIKVPLKVADVHLPYGVVEYKGARNYMEDRSLALSRIRSNHESSVYAVFDGHGGCFASQYCVDNLSRVIESVPSDPFLEPEKSLTQVFRSTDEQLLKETEKRVDAGTTAIVMLVNGKKVSVANAGDSRAVLVQQNGLTKPLSDDHKPDRKDERDRITKLGGVILHWGVWRVEGSLAVSRALGDPKYKKYVIPDPEFVHHTITKNDSYVVIATDGLWDVVRNDEVGRMLASVLDPQAGAEMLCQEAIKRGASDNITIMVVDLQARSTAAAIASMSSTSSTSQQL